MEIENNELERIDDLEREALPIKKYALSVNPNDFNVATLFNYIEEGLLVIPGFQRAYVWDIYQASRLVESIILNIPIPQLFVYEREQDGIKYDVIDGQQRLMTIYYFIKGRFPKKEKRQELARVFYKHGRIPDSMLGDNAYFEDFILKFPEVSPDEKNLLDGENFAKLGKKIQRDQFKLRTIRTMVIKQLSPPDDDSIIYDIFDRLNTGGMNLKPQEVRACIYHSPFYEMLLDINQNRKWRMLLGKNEADLHLKDVEVLLRAFALLYKLDEYKRPMLRFLNNYSRAMTAPKPHTTNHSNTERYDEKMKEYLSDVEYCKELFLVFVEKACSDLGGEAFQKYGRFNNLLFESVFRVSCEDAIVDKSFKVRVVDKTKLAELSKDRDFESASFSGTTASENVKKRIERTRRFLSGG